MNRLFPLLAASAMALLHPAVAADKAHIDEQLGFIQTQFNVRVHYQLDPAAFFPESWRKPTLAMTAREIDLDEVERLVPIIKAFMAKHPASVVRAELEHIYLLGGLSFRGKPYGGTHAGRSMYIICDGVENRYTEEFMLQRFHSEFSSILFEQHPFPAAVWSQLNPAGFTYSGNGFEALDNPSRYDKSERSCSEGFLLNYCRSSMENDFNMISAWLFTKKGELDSASQKHEPIRQKQALAEQFYKSISSQYLF